MTRDKVSSVFDVAASLVMTLAAVVLLWNVLGMRTRTTGSTGAAPIEDVRESHLSGVLDGAFTRGSRSAQIALVEFAYFECPFCGRYARETFDQLDSEFVKTGKLLYAFRQLPLEKAHRSAWSAAVAADCAATQGKFWEMHAFLFDKQATLASAPWIGSGKALGLREGDFDGCVTSNDGSRIRVDMQEATRLGVSGTPTFLLGKLKDGSTIQFVSKIKGARQYVDFKDAIERTLKG
jgi:protein-disulfide isomerase